MMARLGNAWQRGTGKVVLVVQQRSSSWEGSQCMICSRAQQCSEQCIGRHTYMASAVCVVHVSCLFISTTQLFATAGCRSLAVSTILSWHVEVQSRSWLGKT
jgi:hypothetical protein